MEKCIENEFFILDSENIQNVESNIYGYIITNDRIIYDNETLSVNELTGNGTYVSINVDSENIIISQDLLGSYGLYLFESENYFALSNSFVKLEEFIKDKFELSFNSTFAKGFLSSYNASFSFDETLINEIKLIPKNIMIKINILDKSIEYEIVNKNNDCFDLDSEDGVDCLDNWFEKWVNIIRNIKKDSSLFSFDFNSDFSSLVLMALMLNSDIDLENIFINTSNLSSKEYEIITNLSQKYNFTLDSNMIQSSNMGDIRYPINLSFYTKLGFRKQFDFPCNIYDGYYFSINNQDKEYIKNNHIENINDFIETTVNNAKKYSYEFAQSVEKFLWDNVHKVQKHYKIYDIYSDEFNETFYQTALFQNQLGKDNVEDFLINKINLNPLNDTDLQKIKTNENDFLLLIILRYCPELLSYNLNIDNIEEKLNNLKKINEKYPYNKINRDFITANETKNKKQLNDYSINIKEIHDFLTKIFYSTSFKYTFLKYFPKEVYNNIISFYLERNNHFYAEVYTAISIVKILNDIEYSQKKKQESELDWLKSFITTNYTEEEINIPVESMLSKYYTSRIDIKNKGDYSNQIQFLDMSDVSAEITSPAWFINKEGHGNCVISQKGRISFKIKCIGDGDLLIELRTLDVKDRNNNRFPVYIDYMSFKIDNEEYLKENTLTWHNEPIRYHKRVLDGEIIHIDVKWQPFTKLSKYN